MHPGDLQFGMIGSGIHVTPNLPRKTSKNLLGAGQGRQGGRRDHCMHGGDQKKRPTEAGRNGEENNYFFIGQVLMPNSA